MSTDIRPELARDEFERPQRRGRARSPLMLEQDSGSARIGTYDNDGVGGGREHRMIAAVHPSLKPDHDASES